VDKVDLSTKLAVHIKQCYRQTVNVTAFQINRLYINTFLDISFAGTFLLPQQKMLSISIRQQRTFLTIRRYGNG